ncbi:hypothetical protein D1007_20283 [Hordeum vulgare]|nr:hypothetical protein D1007_20283 [Hordeum vulgare]
MSMCTSEAIVLPEGVDAQEGSHVANEAKEDNDGYSMPTSANRYTYEDVDGQLMEDAADDVEDAHDDELVNVYDKENHVIAVGKLFPNMDEFRMCFKTYAVKHEFDAKTKWTDRKKFYARCREKITPILANKPNTTAKKLKVDLEKKYPIKVKYNTVCEAKQRAMKQLYGDWANTFMMLYNFKAEVEKRSRGSVVEIDTDLTEDGRVLFSKFLMALKPWVDGFKPGCRPYLSIDSSFLTGKWNGQLAACNALDGHNWMFHVANGLFQSEAHVSWIWFMMQLKICIGPVSPLVVHTYACKWLENTVKNVFPHSEQRGCFGHMWMNLIKKFRGEEFGRMWPATRSYTKQTYSYHIGKIMTAYPEFGPWVNTYHSLLWYKSGFNTAIKCDHINNNLEESCNNKVKQLKNLPVHDMVDQMRIMIMHLWEFRRSIGDCLQGDKLPVVVQQVVKRSRNLTHLCVEKSSMWGAEVRDTKTGRRHVVNTEMHDCTCLEWQHTGKPCDHAILFLASRPKRKHAGEPLIAEDFSPKKKARGNGCRKKRSFDEIVHSEPGGHIEPDMDGVVQNEQDLDVLLQNDQDLDALVPTKDMGTSVDIPAHVVQPQPILEVELSTDDIRADVVPPQPILEVVLPTDDNGPDDTTAVVVQNEGQAAVPGSPLKKTKSLSELGVVQ